MLTYNISNIENIDIDQMKELFEANDFDKLVTFLLRSYESLGPVPGLLLPFLEAFLPFLPLVVFVITNAAAYGLLEGFLLSWIGASAGAIVVFLIVRHFKNVRLFRWIRKNKQVLKVMNWLERHGFGPLFLLLCFPFSPSAVINLVAALSKVNLYQFSLAVLLGKAVMIFTVSYIGDSIASFAKNPVKSIIVGIGIVVLWLAGKYMEKRLHKRAEKKNLEYRD
ncbi:TVP38/TMEM64 family protein [Gracilibacillus oryzae]|uniref:TVP38/TMEM64 family membrane protein n=1 Tax=Gracilibacillus oryzae TaxID=1672701 RepID=A0A7C8L0Y2_9BACI|nr:TVP38/TMEM64 family protein [Gracilibacillus oryzae]KAB8139195.1 TVP38/TMEM64 family protein [Gracilibacillus oryzae]